MAYQTGSVASPTALKTVIETFCTDNGWTLSGSDYLSKGQSFVKLAVPAGPSTRTMRIYAANSSDGLTTPCPFYFGIDIETANWPVTYYLFANTAPDIVVCALQYATNYIQPIIFGDIVKVHASAYVGGNWFFAPKYQEAIQAPSKVAGVSDSGIYAGINSQNGTWYCAYPIPFANQPHGSMRPVNGFHSEIDGTIWDSIGMSSFSQYVSYTDYTYAAYFRSPNTWNSQAHLVPMHLQHTALGGLVSYLGYVEHLRLIRVDNYEIGDIVTLGSDKWKVFPWMRKNTTKRNGDTTVSSDSASGTLGFAVRYDGP